MKRKLLSLFVLILCLTMMTSTAFASCSHSWSVWLFYDEYIGPSESPVGCRALYEEYERYCFNCEATQYMTVVTELSHVWVQVDAYTKVCTRCGTESILTK